MQGETYRDAQRDRRRGVEAERKANPRAPTETGRQGHGTAGQETERRLRRQRDPRTKHKAGLGTERGTDTPDTQPEADSETRTRRDVKTDDQGQDRWADGGPSSSQEEASGDTNRPSAGLESGTEKLQGCQQEAKREKLLGPRFASSGSSSAL